jgi:GNAT superfamily N-acetyltransferase
MKQELTLERARPEHADTLTRIAIEAKRHWGYPEPWIQHWLPQLTVTPEYILEHETWLASINDEPAAFYALKQEGEDWWLDHLWVRPGAMGQGLGALLFHYARRRARLQGAFVLKIESDPNAQGFYEKLGAAKTGERPSELDGTVRILPLMEIHLK